MAVGLQLGAGSQALAQDTGKDRESQPVRRPAPVEGGPRMSVAIEELDFGTTYDEGKMEGVIRFTNTGDSLLVVQNIRTSCGCTAAALIKREYLPGESGEVEVGFSPKGSGRQTKTVTLMTNDPTNPAQVVRVSANLVPLVEVTDPVLRMGQVEQGQEHVIPLELFSRDPAFRVVNVAFDDASHVTWREVPNAVPAVPRPEMPGYRLVEVVVDKEAPTGNFNRTLTLDIQARAEQTADQKPLNYTVRLFGVVLGDLAIQPRFMRIPRVDPGGSFESSVVITSRSGRPFKITGATIEDSRQMSLFVASHEVTYQPIELPDGTVAYRVTLKGQATNRTGAFRAEITLLTDRPSEGSVVVTANGQVRAAQPAPERPMPKPRD
ncbi:MAG: DUF1573 domain-containing protein [Phycisphaerales bacterium]